MPSPYSILSLAQVTGFEGLTEVCNEFDIEIIARGSLVRRLVMYFSQGNKETDIFALSPFLSDVDLTHTGAPEQADNIRDAVLSRVPYSECFRWEIVCESRLKQFRDDEERLPVIPANKLTLSTRSGDGIQDPFGGVADISSRLFRLLANPYYHRSSLRRQHRDCELLHAMFFLQLLFECAPFKGHDEHPGWDVCRELIEASRRQEMLVALGESAYLRARLRHRLKALYSSCGSLKQWNDGLSKSGLSDSLKFLNLSIYPERRRKESPISFVSSSRLGGDLYRLQDPDLLLTEDDVSISEPVPAEEAWNNLSKLRPIQLSQHAIPQLAEGQSLIGASPVLRFNRDSALRSHPEESVHPGPTAPTARALELSHQEEFVYLELLQSQTQSDTLAASELGVLVALFAEAGGSDEARGGSYCYVVALPGVCSFRDFQGSSRSVRLIQLRVNFGQLLTVFPDVLDRVGIGRISAYALQFFVVAEND